MTSRRGSSSSTLRDRDTATTSAARRRGHVRPAVPARRRRTRPRPRRRPPCGRLGGRHDHRSAGAAGDRARGGRRAHDLRVRLREPGERGAPPHVHREHADAFLVLEGEFTFHVMATARTPFQPARSSSSRRHRARLRQRLGRAYPRPQLPHAVAPALPTTCAAELRLRPATTPEDGGVDPAALSACASRSRFQT